ncbi:unnamed protein product [Cladocopium goreaui]|uniref:Uncharacterized protein n=1 Tax=Cladocopium goreaui TaxID=2562237 RepID=A0A9P1D9D2_9DINO|nr:unnamed protein product [Cladocopium goreaui]
MAAYKSIYVAANGSPGSKEVLHSFLTNNGFDNFRIKDHGFGDGRCLFIDILETSWMRCGRALLEGRWNLGNDGERFVAVPVPVDGQTPLQPPPPPPGPHSVDADARR